MESKIWYKRTYLQNKQIYRHRKQTYITKEERVVKEGQIWSLGLTDIQVVYKTDNQQGPTV